MATIHVLPGYAALIHQQHLFTKIDSIYTDFPLDGVVIICYNPNGSLLISVDKATDLDAITAMIQYFQVDKFLICYRHVSDVLKEQIQQTIRTIVPSGCSIEEAQVAAENTGIMLRYDVSEKPRGIKTNLYLFTDNVQPETLWQHPQQSKLLKLKAIQDFFMKHCGETKAYVRNESPLIFNGYGWVQLDIEKIQLDYYLQDQDMTAAKVGQVLYDILIYKKIDTQDCEAEIFQTAGFFQQVFNSKSPQVLFNNSAFSIIQLNYLSLKKLSNSDKEIRRMYLCFLEKILDFEQFALMFSSYLNEKLTQETIAGSLMCQKLAAALELYKSAVHECNLTQERIKKVEDGKNGCMQVVQQYENKNYEAGLNIARDIIATLIRDSFEDEPLLRASFYWYGKCALKCDALQEAYNAALFCQALVDRYEKRKNQFSNQAHTLFAVVRDKRLQLSQGPTPSSSRRPPS